MRVGESTTSFGVGQAGKVIQGPHGSSSRWRMIFSGDALVLKYTMSV